MLPGVAAFGYAVSALGPLADLIKKVASAGKPVLGICVGYQMLFETSTEHGEHRGLGLIHGNKEKNFYFAHSYYADIIDSDAKIAYTNYGFDLPASVQKANIYGTQFHPEKSGQAGLKVLRNFAQICERSTLKC